MKDICRYYLVRESTGERAMGSHLNPFGFTVVPISVAKIDIRSFVAHKNPAIYILINRTIIKHLNFSRFHHTRTHFNSINLLLLFFQGIKMTRIQYPALKTGVSIDLPCGGASSAKNINNKRSPFGGVWLRSRPRD